MDALDSFTKTFLTATALGKLPTITVARHAQVLRGCAGDRDEVAIAALCQSRQHRRNVFMLTRNRLVVTSESAVLRRVSLHLNAELHQVADVTWTPEPGRAGVQLGLTAIDGVRENFWVRLAGAAEMWRLDEALKQAFRTPWGVVQPAVAAPVATAVKAPLPELRLA
ncbi:hypothetical protein Drose_00530 [Dactylosporangium roseum]|uniref:YokE-like PH domain-containing protein n=1 Tax=Dactylosporangium roseum TaxID=47989 RepID=A0ABY5Z494_9ACTN|nr:hypothetical protein [Dactylosporangium roseum]UWZ36865.1 hypothetical protein Drose_00530 [Dactylosporangium roseum]